MEAIGYQAYYSNRRVIDLAGLVSPAVVRILGECGTNAEAFHRIATELKPDYFVLRGFEVEQNRHFHGGPLFTTERQEADFTRDYSVVKHFVPPYPEILGKNTKLTIYRRNPPTNISDR